MIYFLIIYLSTKATKRTRKFAHITNICYNVLTFGLFDDADRNPNIERDEEAYDSLYFDLEENFYKAELKMIADITNYEEKYITITKLNEPIDEPSWFDESDF